VQSITSWSKELLSMEKPVCFRENKELNLLKAKITSIYFDSETEYKSRMTAELAFFCNKTSRVTVAKYMNQLGLRSKLNKKSR
jgi:hypothetical protein